MKPNKKRTRRRWMIVATAHTERGLREAASLRPGVSGIDLVEVRLDCLAKCKRLAALVRKIRVPLIVTARHPLEGGSGKLDSAARGGLLAAFLPFAAFVDIELRSVGSLRGVLQSARQQRVGAIISFHDFRKTPPLATLRAKVREGVRLGAAAVKVATTLRGPRDLAALLLLQAEAGKVAAMGMGALGKASRLVLPLAGSSLVYGYLDRPQVNGQWPARKLGPLLAELGA